MDAAHAMGLEPWSEQTVRTLAIYDVSSPQSEGSMLSTHVGGRKTADEMPTEETGRWATVKGQEGENQGCCTVPTYTGKATSVAGTRRRALAKCRLHMVAWQYQSVQKLLLHVLSSQKNVGTSLSRRIAVYEYSPEDTTARASKAKWKAEHRVE